jgi:hypothetical protein
LAWGVPKIGAAVAVSSGNLALTEPAGIASGDIMVACIAARDTAAFSLPSADWAWCVTQQSSGNTTTTVGSAIASGAMAWCRRAGSAPALTFTRTGGDVGLGRIIAYSGGLASGNALITGSAETAAANTGSPSTPALDTTGNANALLVAVFAGADNTTGTSLTLVAATDPTGVADDVADTTTAPSTTQWYIRSDDVSNLGGDTALDIGDAVKGTAGSTGTITYGTVGASSRHVVMAAAFKIAAAAAVLDADAGSYSVTGAAASLEVGRQVSADAASYTLTGQAASLEFGRQIVAATVAYTISGQAATFDRTYELGAAAGSYSLTGTAAGLEFGRLLDAEAGAYTITGVDATLTHGTAGAYEIAADAASYTIGGTDAALALGRILNAEGGEYIIVGSDAGLDYADGSVEPEPEQPVLRAFGGGAMLRWPHKRRKKWQEDTLKAFRRAYGEDVPDDLEEVAEAVAEIAPTRADPRAVAAVVAALVPKAPRAEVKAVVALVFDAIPEPEPDYTEDNNLMMLVAAWR